MEKPQIFKQQSEAPAGAEVIDAFNGSLKELFFVDHPNLKKTMPEAQLPLEEFLKSHTIGESWIYFPWSNKLVHTLDEENYFKLRTARNREVITMEEQAKYRQVKIGIAGLSVGSAAVSALSISGGPKEIKIADFDEVEVSNLNRIRAKLTDIGQNKTHVAAKEVWELDPYAQLELWDNGVTKENIKDFLLQPRLDIFVDEMDSIDLKIISRLIARENKIPVLMATDNGDSVILDVERFDLEPDRQIFHGLIGDMQMSEAENLDFRSWLQLATKIVGPEYLTESMQNSLLSIGKTIASVPQLGTTAAIAGSAIAFAVRRIANQELMPSGRYTLGCDEKLIVDYNSEEHQNKRKENTEKFLGAFGKK